MLHFLIKRLTFILISFVLISCGFQGRKYTSGHYFERNRHKEYPINAKITHSEDELFSIVDTTNSLALELIRFKDLSSLELKKEESIKKSNSNNYNAPNDTLVPPKEQTETKDDAATSIIEGDLKKIKIDNIGMASSILTFIISILADISYLFPFTLACISLGTLGIFFISRIIHHIKLKRHLRPFKENPEYKKLNKGINEFSDLLKTLALSALIILVVLIVTIKLLILALH
jgi:hypothetical protein